MPRSTSSSRVRAAVSARSAGPLPSVRARNTTIARLKKLRGTACPDGSIASADETAPRAASGAGAGCASSTALEASAASSTAAALTRRKGLPQLLFLLARQVGGDELERIVTHRFCHAVEHRVAGHQEERGGA